MRRSSRRAFVASAVLVLAACAGGGGSPATRADVEAQVRDELPQQLQQQGAALLARLALASGAVVRVTGTKCMPKANNTYACVADGVAGNGLGGYRPLTSTWQSTARRAAAACVSCNNG